MNSDARIILKRTAIVFGATGLTGGILLEELIANEAYDKIIVFSRRKPEAAHPKVREIGFDTGNIEAIKEEIRGDDLFCCLGTTIKKAGSQEAFRQVDLNTPSIIASIASSNGVKQFLVISSIGAASQSSNFYLRTKGQMEEAIQKNSFEAVAILRPSMITGKRKEFRFAEEAGKFLFKPLGFLLFGKLRKYRSIAAKTIAKAMVFIALHPQNRVVFESNEIQKLVRQI